MKTNVSKLANLVGVSRQRGKQVVDTLALAGFVTVSASAENAHMKFAEVTAKGVRAAAAIDEGVEGQFRQALKGKTLHAEGLIRQLKRFDTAIRRAQPKRAKRSAGRKSGSAPARTRAARRIGAKVAVVSSQGPRDPRQEWNG